MIAEQPCCSLAVLGVTCKMKRDMLGSEKRPPFPTTQPATWRTPQKQMDEFEKLEDLGM